MCERLARPQDYELIRVERRRDPRYLGNRTAFARTSLQQVWLDHLLALSMLPEWGCGLFVLLYPAANASMAGVASGYGEALLKAATFHGRRRGRWRCRLAR